MFRFVPVVIGAAVVVMAGCAHQVPYRGEVVRVAHASGFENGVVVLKLTGVLPEFLRGQTRMVPVDGLVDLPVGGGWVTVAFQGAYDASENTLVVLGPDILNAFARKMEHTVMAPPYYSVDIAWIAREGSGWRLTGLVV